MLHLVEELEQPFERVLMAREENLFLVAKVIIEVALLHVQGGSDLLDRRAVIAETAERCSRALEDLHARRADRLPLALPCGAVAPSVRTRPIRPAWGS